eukprot:CAMPEP_0114241388 /NCGR_PEP_ID=MMETSP0058-20121206/9606_1 /TAXON_ID=36894 /ORGANISM="Pyramimonas parkeae, CCMP726" /LENGTH=428 /DNA_ID=CAMNT_0001353911 /DNA_START=12 /DNA_END=1298 /DNA_ORIENTATION=+
MATFSAPVSSFENLRQVSVQVRSRRLLDASSFNPGGRSIADLAADMKNASTHIRAQRVAANLRELENLLSKDGDAEGRNKTLEAEVQRILSEAEHRVANLENRVLAGVTTHGEDHNHSIEHLEEELAKAQAHSREVDTLQKQWEKEKADMDHKLRDLEATHDPLEQIRRVHDSTLEIEKQQKPPEYDIGMPPHMLLYNEHVGRTAQVMQEHLGPLVHRGMDAMDDTTSHVEEVIFHVQGRDINAVPKTHWAFKLVHVAVCFVVLTVPAMVLVGLLLGMKQVLREYKVLSLKGFIGLCHQYIAGLCALAMVGELWSGLEPMHLFFALDYHSYVVFNFITAGLYCIYWLALLIRSVVAKGKTATTVAVIQLLTVSAIGSEWYYAVFHRAMLKLPPYMDLSTYAAYAGAFLFMILLVMISTPTKNTETKSM